MRKYWQLILLLVILVGIELILMLTGHPIKDPHGNSAVIQVNQQQ